MSFTSSGLKCYLDFISLNKDSMPIEAFPPPHLCNELQTTESSVGEIIIILLYIFVYVNFEFSAQSLTYTWTSLSIPVLRHPAVFKRDEVSQNHRITERLQLAGTSGSIQPNAKSRVCRAISRQLVKVSKEDTLHPLWAACAHIEEAFTDVQRGPPLFYLVPVACGTPWNLAPSLLDPLFLCDERRSTQITGMSLNEVQLGHQI